MKPHLSPRLISRREFTDYPEDEIDRITAAEREKLEESPYAMSTMDEVEDTTGGGGTWEQHWITLDSDGTRVLANIYYYGDVGVAVTADGRVVHRFRTDV